MSALLHHRHREGRRPWRSVLAHGLPRRCATRNDGGVDGPCWRCSTTVITRAVARGDLCWPMDCHVAARLAMTRGGRALSALLHHRYREGRRPWRSVLAMDCHAAARLAMTGEWAVLSVPLHHRHREGRRPVAIQLFYRYCPISSLAMVPRCTSSGPSARRRVRALA